MGKPINVVGKIKATAQIGKYYYAAAQIDNTFYICLQQMGDKGWLVKPETFSSKEEAIKKIKETEKEHYDAIKFKTKASASV